eukprot:TRINITY_DN61833_c0_g1_i1.p1 TRINITY_DN61833_c0_g1~~TRINITY_DN61833_c0_g1_i1.p1  ORF type:complete len:460 (+),score=66.93 TRINITY_DN61833_c0_g1_i1:32-1411(+)
MPSGCHRVRLFLGCFVAVAAQSCVPDVNDAEVAADEELGVLMLQTSLMLERSPDASRAESGGNPYSQAEAPTLSEQPDTDHLLNLAQEQAALPESLAVGLAKAALNNLDQQGHQEGPVVVNLKLKDDNGTGGSRVTEASETRSVEVPYTSPFVSKDDTSSDRESRVAIATACITLVLAVGCLVSQCTHGRSRADSDVDERALETDCGGLCPCALKADVPQEDLHSWELSGREIFGGCPSFIPFPRDLTARQWTWRIAEINVWIQVIVCLRAVHQSYWIPRAVLKELQCVFAALMLIASLFAVWWVHQRAVASLLQFTFFALITKAMYVSAKYAVLSSLVTACKVTQSSFAGCFIAGPLAKCLYDNNCTQAVLEKTSCTAPGSDTCASISIVYPETGKSPWVFIADVIDLCLFLLGIVPVFMAAMARESRPHCKASEETVLSPVHVKAPVQEAAMKHESG